MRDHLLEHETDFWYVVGKHTERGFLYVDMEATKHTPLKMVAFPTLAKRFSNKHTLERFLKDNPGYTPYVINAYIQPVFSHYGNYDD